MLHQSNKRPRPWWIDRQTDRHRHIQTDRHTHTHHTHTDTYTQAHTHTGTHTQTHTHTDTYPEEVRESSPKVPHSEVLWFHTKLRNDLAEELCLRVLQVVASSVSQQTSDQFLPTHQLP